MPWHTLALDIDGSIPAQTRVLERLNGCIDGRALEHELRVFAGRKAIEQVRRVLPCDSAYMAYVPSLTFLGSGDLHHLTALLIESLPSACRPITLVLFDNHPDWHAMPGFYYHCGSWLAAVLKLPFVEEIILIGQDSGDLDGYHFWTAPLNELCSAQGRVTLIPYEKSVTIVAGLRLGRHHSRIASPFGPISTRFSFDTICSLGLSKLCCNLSAHLAGKNVYISIDKDVLDIDYAFTDWDQGRLTRDQLLQLIAAIASNSRLVGADICGERAPGALPSWLRKLDSGRLFYRSRIDWDTANNINQLTNMILLDLFELLQTGSGRTPPLPAAA